jgi:chromosome segregation ATPase
MAAPAPAYAHPAANPLLAPLTQLGNLLNTNYTNSWTLREIIRNNAQHILDQLERIRMAAIQLQNRAQLAQARIPQLEGQIAALEAQLAAQGPGHPAPNVAALQQQIADLTAQRDDYVRWVNESLGLINQYNNRNS